MTAERLLKLLEVNAGRITDGVLDPDVKFLTGENLIEWDSQAGRHRPTHEGDDCVRRAVHAAAGYLRGE